MTGYTIRIIIDIYKQTREFYMQGSFTDTKEKFHKKEKEKRYIPESEQLKQKRRDKQKSKYNIDNGA